MPHTPTPSRRRWARLAPLAVLVALLVAYVAYFPGRQGTLAFTLATGVGVESVQRRVDSLEDRAVRGGAFSDDDRAFLRDLYTCLAKGARLTIVLRQSSVLMFHYLDGTGTPLALEPRIFVDSVRVQAHMDTLRARIARDAAPGRSLAAEYDSGTFYMPHPSSPDSVFGLYHGRLLARPRRLGDGRVVVHWRAEVPWHWPSYESLRAHYGTPHAERFPLPNARVLFFGPRYALRVDNGLGEYIAHLGLARPFLAYAEWDAPLGG